MSSLDAGHVAVSVRRAEFTRARARAEGPLDDLRRFNPRRAIRPDAELARLREEPPTLHHQAPLGEPHLALSLGPEVEGPSAARWDVPESAARAAVTPILTLGAELFVAVRHLRRGRWFDGGPR